jgi:hypothetical protein
VKYSSLQCTEANNFNLLSKNLFNLSKGILMNKLQLTGAALAVGAAAMFALAPAFAAETTAAPTVQCTGGNACKGQSSCKTADNACKGQNACKGKGVAQLSTKEDCEKAGGKVAE